MRSIDIHAHTFTPTMLKTLAAGQEWYGMKYTDADQRNIFVREGKIVNVHPKCKFTPEERVADMDQLGTEVQVVAIHTPVFGYHLSPADGLAQAREVNDDIAAFAKESPTRFAGMATLPMQDVDASIAELDRAVNTLGLKGAELDTVVNGKTWDEPEFLPFFKAAESMGATLFYHPQPQHNLMLERTAKYGLNNSVGVPVEDTLLVAALIYGGVMENCPDLKVCVAHGGGPACFGMGRMDRGWQVRSEARVNIYPPAQLLPEPPVLRHCGNERAVAAVPDRPGGRRAGGAGQRLSLRRLGPVAHGLAAKPGEHNPGREGHDPVEKPGEAAGN